MSTTPATYDLTVLQYATFKMTLALSDASGSAIDVSGWTFEAEVKEKPGVVGEGVATMTVEVASATDGQLSINLPATETAKLIKPKYFYDIIAKNAATTPTEVYRLLQGKVSVNLGVTDI
jgi:hypothetical protein